MTFEKIIEDGRLWAVRYDGESENALGNLFNSGVTWSGSVSSLRRTWTT